MQALVLHRLAIISALRLRLRIVPAVLATSCRTSRLTVILTSFSLPPSPLSSNRCHAHSLTPPPPPRPPPPYSFRPFAESRRKVARSWATQLDLLQRYGSKVSTVSTKGKGRRASQSANESEPSGTGAGTGTGTGAGIGTYTSTVHTVQAVSNNRSIRNKTIVKNKRNLEVKGTVSRGL